MKPLPDFKQSVVRMLEEGSELRGGHPDVDAWISYLKDELEPAEHARLQDHLAGCRECVALLRELESFYRPGAGEISEFERAAAWRAVQKAIAEFGSAPEREDETSEATASPIVHRSWIERHALPVAASLLLAVAGVGGWGGLQQQRADDLRQALNQPAVNTPIVDLRPIELRRGPQQEVDAVPDTARFITVILHPEGAEIFSDYRVEIRDAAGELIWQRSGLELLDPVLGTIHLTLSRQLLPPGDYVIRVYGGNQDEPLREHELRVEATGR